ncbi:hypothetical protein EON63_17465 [archaeon]|nr:MAG: hypothetical protein EON63_17465 [archaeon]
MNVATICVCKRVCVWEYCHCSLTFVTSEVTWGWYEVWVCMGMKEEGTVKTSTHTHTQSTMY